MQINIKITGLDEIRKELGNLSSQVNYAASRALNTTAYAINAKLKTEMASKFKGGATPFSPVSYTHLTLPTNREV